MSWIDGIDRRSVEAQLDPSETRRYGRHLVLPEVGVEGQQRLKSARVLLIGVGGLGSPAALYLAAAGVGTLGLADFDRVDESNLQRQVLYGQGDVGRSKIEAAIDRLRQANPGIRLVAHEGRIDRDNILDRIDPYDLVLDGSDNAETRYLVNDACLVAGKPNIWGAVLRFEGQVSVFAAPGGPCYRCLFPEPPPAGVVPSCAEGGVLGVLPGVIGSLQANEAIKMILGIGEPLIGRFVVFDALQFRFREVSLPQDPACPSCGTDVEPSLADDYALACELSLGGVSAGLSGTGAAEGDDPSSSPQAPKTASEPMQERQMSVEDRELPFDIDVRQLKSWRDQGVEHVLVDVREPQEIRICRIDDAVVIPMREIPQRLEELDRGQLTVVHCHHGGRSAQVVQFLRAHGFTRVTNLAGGIEAWSLEIDPSVPRY